MNQDFFTVNEIDPIHSQEVIDRYRIGAGSQLVLLDSGRLTVYERMPGEGRTMCFWGRYNLIYVPYYTINPQRYRNSEIPCGSRKEEEDRSNEDPLFTKSKEIISKDLRSHPDRTALIPNRCHLYL